MNKIYEIAKKVVYSYKKRFRIETADCEDYIQDAVIYIEEYCGDIERNFGEDKKIFLGTIYRKVNYFILGKITKDKKLQWRKTELTKKYTNNHKEYEYLPDEEMTVEEAAISIVIGEKCINRLKQLVKEGKDKKVALEEVVNEFNISKEELLSIMATYLSSRNKKHRKKQEASGYDDGR